MARITHSLVMPDGDEYEFIGKTYFGICASSGNSGTKYVYISGFTSSSLENGTRITVYFANLQNTATTVYLNVSGTGSIPVLSRVGTPATRFEWMGGDILSFIYYDGGWVIEGGGHAYAGGRGNVMLSDTIGLDNSTALTPYAVYNAGFLTLEDLPIYDGSVT